MTKLQLLHRALNERLMAAVEQIMEMVGDTVLEYEEETIRARKENELLRRRLRWMEGANRADWPGPSEPVMLSTMDEASPSRQDEGAANIGFGQQSEALEIKTESTDLPLCIRPESSVTTFPQSIDQGSDNAGTGAGIAYGLTDSMTWDSGQSYMAPLDFDPTPGPSRVRRWRGRNRRQRMSFACPDCGKVFGREQRLMVHMRIHSTERPYAYRRRKACFYGDNRKKRKLHRLSQLSREIVDDLSDGSEQTNRSSASPEQLETTAPGLEEEPESDHTSSDKEPEKRITTSVRNQHEKKVVNQMCHCPHCPHRVFARPCQLAMHMKTHTVTTHVNRPTQAQSGTREIVDVNRNLPKRQRKKNVEKKPKVADNHEHHCPDCDRVFSYASRLRFHMKSHNSKKALLLKTLPIKAEVTKEDTTVAVLKKTYACPHCDKLFTREGWLLPHIRSQHKEVKNRSDYVDMFASRLTRSQQPFTMQFRKRTTTKWGEDTKDLRLKKQKTKESRRSKAKLLQTSDESILVVDVSTVTNDEAEQSADPPTMSTDEAEQSEDLLKPGTAEAEQSEDLLKPGTDEAEQSEDLLKPGTDEAEQSEDLLKPGTDEAEQTEDLLKPGTDEAEQCKDLLKTGTNETEKSEDLLKTGTNEGQKSADLPKTGTDESESPSEQSNLKRMFPCKTCGKEFVVEKRLKKHSRTHVGHKLQNEKKRKRALMEMELEEQERRSEEKERLDDKMSSNHNPSTAQMPQGSPKKEPLQKSKTRGQGPLPCPFCGKVFAWEMRLLMHMQIHCGEKPYAYRQRTRRFYGDLKRGQLPKIHSQEPLGDKSGESEESECEEIVNKDRSTHLSSIATHAVSGALASSIETTVPENYTGSPDLLPQRAIEQPTTSYKSNQTTKPELVSDIKSHFNLQPRIVLQPIMTEYKYWSSVPRVADFKSGCFEISSGFDHKQTSYPVLVDDEMVNAVEDKTVVSNFCTLPLEFSSHGIQNKSEICHNGNPETEVVFVEVGSPQHDSEEEPDNIGGPLGIESPEGKDMENQQKDDSNYNFRGVSEKTARNQGPGCQTNSTDDNSSEFKIHHCFYCNQPHNRMMDHLQSVHPNEPEVAKALTFDKSSQEREQLLNLLQTRGNVLHNTNVVQSSKQDLEPFGKDKSTQNAEDSCGEMLPIAGPIPPAPTLISPSSPEEIDAKIEPSGFHCLNTIYETDFENEQGSSSNPDLSCNVEQPDISSPNDEVRNGRQAEGDFLQFRHSPENEVGYELKSDNSPNPSTGQESTDCKNEGVSLPKCDVDQERAMTPTSDTSPHPEYDVLRNPYDDFSPPKNAPTVSYDTQKSSVKAQTCETGKKRRKRCSHVDNQPLIKDDDLVGEGEMSISKLHVCQHCKATFGSPYMLHRHEHTHTGDTSSSADQEKLKRAKRLIQDVETSMMDEASIEPSTKSPEDLPNAVTDGTGGQVVAIKQDTEVREIQFEEAGQQRL
ncbi:zinc finger protein 236 isoform X4 [Carassius gibelio]|uniref:zinc finger protein 236 isoform X4 n=1 Tax=Carassius gibelio TaxID=101364 RepID=UPI00227771B5|nr:zinc finger protein 236 isoform X4 [Carassius gibelio]